MADVELVIKIPKDKLWSIKNEPIKQNFSIYELASYIDKGIPIPEGHEKIVDEVEEKAYNRGLNEAWDAARKIHDGQIPYEVFGLDKTGNGFTYASPLNWGENITAQEAIAKIKAYEEKQDETSKIKAGDEVRDVLYGHIGVVITDKPTTYDQISVWFPYYSHVQLVAIDNLIKTGKHYSQISEVQEELRGAGNDE